jgi:hypothetical protein
LVRRRRVTRSGSRNATSRAIQPPESFPISAYEVMSSACKALWKTRPCPGEVKSVLSLDVEPPRPTASKA